MKEHNLKKGRLLMLLLSCAMVLAMMPGLVKADNVWADNNVASVTTSEGTTTYTDFNDALAAWTNGSTLTLLANVTTTATKKLEYQAGYQYNLELGEYTWTAQNCDAIELHASGTTPAGGSNGLKITATGDGGITAGSDYTVIYQTTVDADAKAADKGIRPRIEVRGGEYNGGYFIQTPKQTGSTKYNTARVYLYNNGEGNELVVNGKIDLYLGHLELRGGTYNSEILDWVQGGTQYFVLADGIKMKYLPNGEKTMNESSNCVSIDGEDTNLYVVYDGEYYNVVSTLGNVEAQVPFNNTELTLLNWSYTGMNNHWWESSTFKKYNTTKYTNNIQYTEADTAISKHTEVYLNENVTSSQNRTLKNATFTLHADSEGASYTGTITLNNKNAKFIIIGQEATVEVGSSCSDYYKVNKETSGSTYTYTLVLDPEKTDAKIGDTYYKTVNEALEKIQTGETITVLRNATVSTCADGTPNGGALDLNGKTITIESSYGKLCEFKNAAYSLTVKDSVGGGAITTANNQGPDDGLFYFCSGTLNIESGTYTSTGNASLIVFDSGEGNVYITGGTFNGNFYYAGGDAIKDRLFISGGTFSFDPSAYLVDGYAAKKVGDNWTVYKPVAQVGSTKYESLSDAIAAVTNNETLTLLSDITLGTTDAAISIPAAFKGSFDLNGHKIERLANSEYVLDIVNGADITLTDSAETKGYIKGTPIESGNSTNPASLIRDKGKLTLDGAALISDYTCVKVDEDPGVGEFVMTSGSLEIISNTKGYTGATFAVMDWGKATINGGTVTGNVQVLECKDNNASKYGQLTINGGTFDPAKIYFYLYDTDYQPTAKVASTVTTLTPEIQHNAGGSIITSETKSGYTTYSVAEPVAQITKGEVATKYATLADAIKAVEANTATEIVMLSNTKENVTIPASKIVTLDLNGKTVDGDKKGSVVTVAKSADFTLKDSSATNEEKTNGTGKITNGSQNIGGGVSCSGKFTLESGNITNNQATGNSSYSGGGVFVSGTFIMNGGAVTNNTGSKHGAGIALSDSGTIGTINGGLIDGNSTTGSGSYKGGGIGIFAGAKLTVNGGTISNNTSTHHGGGISITGGTSQLTITGGTITGNTSAGHGGGITVEAGQTTITGGTIKDNTAAGGGGNIAVSSYGAFEASGGTIGSGTAEVANSNSFYIHSKNRKNVTLSGNVVIEDTVNIGLASDAEGSISITGGRYKKGIYNYQRTEFISGGIFTKESKEAIDDTLLAEGKMFVENTDTTTKKEYPWMLGDAVAQITVGETTTKYASIEEAFAAANSGDTIKMLADVELSQGIDLAKDVTLDLNGKAISAVATGWTKNSTAGTDGKCDYIFGIRRGGKLTVNDSSEDGSGAINTNGNSDVWSAIKMTIYGDGATGDAAELIVNGGTITGYYYAIVGNGNRHDTAITINDGTLTATAANDNLGIYNPQDGSVTINGGTITAYSSAVEMRSGEITVTGGTLTATSPNYSCDPNGSGTTTIGAALAIAQHTTQVDIDVEITGGRFTGVKAINESNPQGNVPAPKVTMSVTGGRFKGEITLTDTLECLAGGIYSVQPSDTYLVTGKAFKGNIDASTVGEYPYMVDEADKVVISTSSTLQVGTEKKSTTVATITGGGQYKAGTKVTLKATAVDANSIFTFDGWYVNGTKIENAGAEYTFTAEADAEYVANFTTSSTQEITTTVSKTGDDAAVAEGTVTVKAGSETGSTSTTKQIGTEVELTATAGTNTYFICWENTDGNVVSTSPTFKATPVQTQTISAVFYDEAAARVSFNDDSGALLKAQMYKESEAGEVTDVVAPAKRGQDFKGWSGTDGTVMTDKQVASAIKTAATEAGEEVKAGRKSSALGIVNVQAVYEKATTYKIIIHSIDSEGTTVCRDLEATATYGESHVVTASLTCGDKSLVGFSKTDDEKDIFTNSASFTISPDEDDVTNGKVEYYAIYGKAPASRIAALSLGKFFDGSTNVHMLAATMSWSLPEGATLVEAGFYYSTSGVDDLNLCNKTYTTTLEDTSGSYTVYMNLQGYETYYMYMRAFVKYTDKGGKLHTVVNGVEASDSGAEVTADNPISDFGCVKKCWNDVKPKE